MTIGATDVQQLCLSDFVWESRVGDTEVFVVPSRSGWERIVDSGKAGFIAAITGRPASNEDLRQWRVVRRIPPDDQPQPPWQPDWSVTEAGPEHWSGVADICADLAVFRGHFPEEPIVPGVAQIVWIAALVRDFFAPWQATGKLELVKFKHVIRPGDRVAASLELNTERGRVQFVCRSGERIFSDGRLQVARHIDA